MRAPRCARSRRAAPACSSMRCSISARRDVRRRLPAVLAAGEPELAAWGLWRGLADPSFDVRYRCGAALSRLAADSRVGHVGRDEVFEAVRGAARRSRRVEGAQADRRSRDRDRPTAIATSGSTHVFRVLGLVLPPSRCASRSTRCRPTTRALRGTALEYLESILPADVRAQLWPLLETTSSGAPSANAVVDAATVERDRSTLLAADGRGWRIRRSPREAQATRG